MKIGKLVFAEGGVFENITLLPSVDFPSNGNVGQLHSQNGKFCHHDGTDWQVIPTKESVQELITLKLSNGKLPAFRTLLNVRTWINGRGGGNFWPQNNVVVTSVTAGVGVSNLPVFWYDPADYPAGTKFRVAVNVAVNAANTSSTTIVTVGFCKVLRPTGSAGGSNLVIYTPDTDVMSIDFLSIPARTLENFRTDEFTMPAEAGLYAFRIQLSNSNNSSTAHYDMNLQAKF